MKKILIALFSFTIGFSLIGQAIFAATIERLDNKKNDFPFKEIEEIQQTQKEFNNQQEGTEDLGKMMAKTTLNKQSFLNMLLDFFGFNDNEYYRDNGTKVPVAIIYIKSIINLLLSLLSVIALVILIYTFYLMFGTDDASGIEQVKKNLKGIIIALVILGLSWAIVSFIFNFYQNKVLSPEEKDLNIPSEQHDNEVNTI